MSSVDNAVLVNTEEKLRLLEEMYEEARREPDDDEHLREVELESLKHLINQLKEEIALYKIHGTAEPLTNRFAARNLSSEQELENTREKLHRLEARYEQIRRDSTEDPHVRKVTMLSLKRLINQFKEEIARYEAHLPARGRHS
jgi:hypothetical protein